MIQNTTLHYKLNHRLPWDDDYCIAQLSREQNLPRMRVSSSSDPMLRAGFYLTAFPQSKTVMKRATVYKTLATCWTWCEMPSKPFLPRLTLRPPVGMPYDPRATGVGIPLPKILNTVRSTSDCKECSPCNRHWIPSLRLGESRPGKVKLKCFIIITPNLI